MKAGGGTVGCRGILLQGIDGSDFKGELLRGGGCGGGLILIAVLCDDPYWYLKQIKPEPQIPF